MVTSDLGACEWFVWDLRRSGLIDRGHLDQVVGEYLKRVPRAEPPALAEYLVGQNVLTPFQAERVLQGKTQGLVLGPYVLVDAIGSGSMGQVYKAQSKTDGQWYAVKVLPRRSMWNVRLARRQVRAFAQFTHPAVVPFLDVGTAGGQHYLVWPLVEGETLEAHIQREGRLPVAAAAEVMAQVAQGLTAAHQHGLFHGLLKPSNIMLGLDGQVRILDFGIGSLLAENEGESLVDTMSTANTLTSGLDCSSPESIMEPTNRTQAGDQYSFGCVLYFCLAGKYPYPDGSAVEKMMAHQFKPPTPIRESVPDVPDGLVAVLDRLMQKAPDGRYAGADEVVEALLPLCSEQTRRAAVAGVSSGSSHGSHHGSQFGGSYPGTSRFGGSQFGSRSGITPVPSSHAGLAASAHVPTPPGGPFTPAPMPRLPVAPPAPPAPAAAPIPTRASMANTPSHPVPAASAPRIPAAPNRLPVAQPVAHPAPQNLPSAAPVWEEPKKEEAGLSLLMIVMIAGLVMVGVYLLGKNFLFA